MWTTTKTTKYGVGEFYRPRGVLLPPAAPLLVRRFRDSRSHSPLTSELSNLLHIRESAPARIRDARSLSQSRFSHDTRMRSRPRPISVDLAKIRQQKPRRRRTRTRRWTRISPLAGDVCAYVHACVCVRACVRACVRSPLCANLRALHSCIDRARE